MNSCSTPCLGIRALPSSRTTAINPLLTGNHCLSLRHLSVCIPGRHGHSRFVRPSRVSNNANEVPFESSDDESTWNPSSCQYGENWQRMLVQLPLEIASAMGDEDAHYLEKRRRKRWWKRSGASFPRLPPASFAKIHANPPPLSLWQKVLPLAGIFFAASFNLTILQTLKDAILVTSAGAEVLPFLAAFGVLPASLAFFVFYGRLVESVPQRLVFYVAVLPLILFYVSFALFIYPHHTLLHPTGLADTVSTWLPSGLMGLVKGVEYWTFSLFFCVVRRSSLITPHSYPHAYVVVFLTMC